MRKILVQFWIVLAEFSLFICGSSFWSIAAYGSIHKDIFAYITTTKLGLMNLAGDRLAEVGGSFDDNLYDTRLKTSTGDYLFAKNHNTITTIDTQTFRIKSIPCDCERTLRIIPANKNILLWWQDRENTGAIMGINLDETHPHPHPIATITFPTPSTRYGTARPSDTYIVDFSHNKILLARLDYAQISYVVDLSLYLVTVTDINHDNGTIEAKALGLTRTNTKARFIQFNPSATSIIYTSNDHVNNVCQLGKVAVVNLANSTTQLISPLALPELSCSYVNWIEWLGDTNFQISYSYKQPRARNYMYTASIWDYERGKWKMITIGPVLTSLSYSANLHVDLVPAVPIGNRSGNIVIYNPRRVAIQIDNSSDDVLRIEKISEVNPITG